MDQRNNQGNIGWCQVCQKKLYTDRKSAKHVARQHHPRKGTYPCPDMPGMWHVGQLADPIKQGVATRTEFYRSVS